MVTTERETEVATKSGGVDYREGRDMTTEKGMETGEGGDCTDGEGVTTEKGVGDHREEERGGL